MDQEQIFMQSEGNAWFARNQQLLNNKNLDNDIYVKVIDELALIKPHFRVLEIGCANAYRLDYLHKRYQAQCVGIEPAKDAVDIAYKEYPNIEVKQATADAMPLADNQFDLVIIGFCLYLCSPDKLFKIAYEVDRVLKNNGNLMICDFFTSVAYKKYDTHAEQIAIHKMDYSRFFLAHPHYQTMYAKVFNFQCENFSEDYDDNLSVKVLHKKKENAFIHNPY